MRGAKPGDRVWAFALGVVGSRAPGAHPTSSPGLLHLGTAIYPVAKAPSQGAASILLVQPSSPLSAPYSPPEALYVQTYSKSNHFSSALQLPRWSQAPLLLAGREQWLLRWPPSPSSRGSAVTLSAVQQTGEHLCSSTSRLQWPPWLRPQLAESRGTGPANRPSPSSSSQRAPCPLGPTSGPLHGPSPLPRPLIPRLSALSFWSVQMPRPL